MRKIGKWEENTARGDHDAGLFLEAIDLPLEARRYMQASYMMIPDDIIRRLERGEVIRLTIDPDDLQERIT